jgi:hypothetical protein
MDIMQAVGALYAAGIDCGLESFQGYGITAWVVDDRNRRIERRFRVDELAAVSEWLCAEGGRQGSFERAYRAHARDLLAELTSESRKDAKRVEVRDRELRRSDSAAVDGTHF